MSLDLKPEMEAVIREKVASGHYRDEAQVVSEAMALLVQRDKERVTRLRDAIAEGRQAFTEGHYITLRTDEEIDAYFAGL